MTYALPSFEEHEARARELTMRHLARHKKAPDWYRKLFAGKFKRPAEILTRRQRYERVLQRLADRNELRERMADKPIPVQWSPSTQEFFDEQYDWALSRAQREVPYAITRVLVAEKYEALAEWAYLNGSIEQRQHCLRIAEKLRRAHLKGHHGYDRETLERYLRYFDRSGLARLDPAEANRETARQIRRTVPVLMRYKAAGCLLYKAVFSIPNVPLGSLAWAKRELFRRMDRAMRAFPEIIGRFDCQEDPLAADMESWNVHNNVILVVDPARCTPLDDALMQQYELELRGNSILKFPARKTDDAPRGLLSYNKLHYVWGRNQVEIRKLEAPDAEALEKIIKEQVKYAVKWVGKKDIERMAAGRTADPAGPGAPALHGSRAIPGDGYCSPGAADRSEGAPARNSHPLFDAAPDGLARAARPYNPSRKAPPLIFWPLPPLAEWDTANSTPREDEEGRVRRSAFRRVRTYGVLYAVKEDELPPDPEASGNMRWCGRVRVTPQGAHVEAARLLFIDLIHGDKSGADFRGSSARSPGALARAGPLSAQGQA